MERKDYKRAITVLNRMYGGAIHGYIRQMVGADDLADDVAQITFVQAYRDMHSFGGRSSLRTWLYGIARHRCLDALKARARHRMRFASTDEAPEQADGVPGADQRLSDRALVSALENCIQKLEPHVRTAVLLRYQEGFSYNEIAVFCRVRPETLRARVSRALPVLRACIERQGEL
jgi:RNA polymerase sigma-70 factor (ECF subfamily)